jgi:rod shape-determining protein MreC
MLNVLAQYRHIWLFILLLLFSMVLLSFNRPADTIIRPSNVMERIMLFVLQPFQSAASRIVSKIQHVWHGYIVLVHLHEENQRLQEKIKLLQAEKNQYIEKSLAYDRLKGTLELIEERNLSAIPARVIGYDPTNQTNTIVVNKGTNDGVQESWPVITQDGIAGMTVAVSKNASKILLLIDPNCNVAALVQRTRDQGIVGGQSKKEAYLMKYVSRRADIREGAIYQLTDLSLKELANEGIPGFRLTDHSFNELREAAISEDILTILEELKGLLYVSQVSFVHTLELTIGKEYTEQYESIIVKYALADILQKLQDLKNQKYTTEEEFINALETTIGKENTMQYKALILRYVQEEETIVSSGLGGIFPKGLLIGTVSKIIKQDYGLFQNIEVTPSVDFSKLEEVLIIRRKDMEPIQ